MTSQNKAKKTGAKPSGPKTSTASETATTPLWGGLLGEAFSQSLDVVGSDTLDYTNRVIEQTMTNAGALAGAKSLGDVVEVQARCATQAFDYWTKLGETAAQTESKSFASA